MASYKSHVLYIGGISWWVTDADIRRTFDQFGTINEVKIHADKVNGKSKGYGYVEFDSRELEAAVIAKQKLHGHIISDCRISVAFASPERVKGAEYTNTPVHIPRQKLHNVPGTVIPSNGASIFPKIGTFAGPATVIPSGGVMKFQKKKYFSRSVLPSAVAAAAAITARNAAINNMPSKQPTIINTANAANASTANQGESKGINNGMSILSKFTDQAQLLALLNKTANRGQGRSVSRSATRSGSRSRTRSRSRSREKHRRRRHRDRERKKRREKEDNHEQKRREKRRRHRHRHRDDTHYNRHRHRHLKDDNIPITTTTTTTTTATESNNVDEEE